MKHLTSYTTLLLLGLVFPFISFSQINPVDFSQDELPTIRTHNHTAIALQGNEDLIIASQTDYWDYFTGLYSTSDSTEYYYENDLLTKLIFRNLENNEWSILRRVIYEYDANANPTLELRQNWTDSTWQNTLQYVSEYDNNNRTSFLRQNWNEDNWVNFSLETVEYDENSNITLRLKQNWEDDNWENSSHQMYEYDEYNNITYYLEQSTFFGNQHFQIHYQYDGTRRISSLRQDWVENNWLNSLQSFYEYDTANDQLTRLLTQRWEEGNWIDGSLSLYEYDDHNNRTLWHRQSWNGMNWESSRQSIYEYDDNDNQMLHLIQDWSSLDEAWVNYLQHIKEYDGNNNLIFELIQFDRDMEWVNDIQVIYYYELVNTNTNNVSLDYNFQTFPNPTTGQLTIDFGENDIQNGQLNLYNSIGKLTHKQTITKGMHTISIQLNHLLEGIYVLQVMNGEQQTTQSVIIVR